MGMGAAGFARLWHIGGVFGRYLGYLGVVRRRVEGGCISRKMLLPNYETSLFTILTRIIF